MKKKQLETLEKIKEERKLDNETKEKICKIAFKNFISAIVVILLFCILKLVAINLEKEVAILIYRVFSIVALISILILFEISYKKNSDTLIITSIEMFLVAIITLLAPYILINRPNVYTSSFGVFFAIYYSIKNFIIYRKEKKNYLREKNDINQIIKKESKDNLAQEQLEKIRKEKEIKPKRKRGRPKKVK